MRKQFLSIFIVVLPGFTVFAQNVERKHDLVLEKVQNCLITVLKPLNPEPSIEYAKHSKSLIIKYRTRKFMVHSGSKIGRFSEKAHEAVGPDFDGFMLQVHVQDAGTVNQARTPQTVWRPYWKTDLDVTQIAGTSKQIYWGLSYGSSPDGSLLSRVGKTLRELEGHVGDRISTRREAEKPLSVRNGDELTGVFKNNVKGLSPYLLKIDGGNSIYLRGDILKNVPDGIRIWLSGEIHSVFYDNSSDPRLAMMPLQWHVFMDVKKYRKISKPFEQPQLAEDANYSLD